MRRGQIQAKRGDFDEAQTVFDRLIERVPSELRFRSTAAETMLSAKQGARALQFARINVRAQREPIDVLLLTAAARASGQSETHNEGRALAREIGLHDQRLAS